MQMSQDRTGRPTSLDAGEVDKFSRLSQDWWSPEGPLKALHWINPLRIGWLRDRIVDRFADEGARPVNLPLKGLSILDVGCGAGLVSEPMRRLGAQVTGIDASDANIAAARAHARSMGLDIDYRCASAEDLAQAGESFDAVLALEIVEHVAEPGGFVASCAALTRPGGLLCLSTLNRTFKSYALAIVAAEYVLRWTPRGAHRWEKFVTPKELAEMAEGAGCRVEAKTGLIFDPLRRAWRLSPDMDVNYMIAAAKRDDLRSAPRP